MRYFDNKIILCKIFIKKKKKKKKKTERKLNIPTGNSFGKVIELPLHFLESTYLPNPSTMSSI